MKLDYFYSQQSEQFVFYRVPKALFTDSRFSSASALAKLLYGLMMDRMALSRQNGWIDEKDRVFIYFTNQQIQAYLDCGHCKATSLLKELCSVGLVERQRQGMGRPDRIYVMDFVSKDSDETNSEPHQAAEIQQSESETSIFQPSRLPKNSPQTAEIQPSNVLRSSSQDVRKTAPNKTEINNIKNNHTESSNIHLHPLKMTVREKLKDKWGYIALRDQHSDSELEPIFSLGEELLRSQAQTVRVNQERIPKERLVERLLSLDFTHIDYVLELVHKAKTQIHNMRSYLITLLYNAPTTIDAYYAAMVARDMATFSPA